MVRLRVPDAAAQAQRQKRPKLYDLDHMDVSPPLKNMKPIPPDWLRDKEVHPVKPLPHHHAPRALTTQDPAPGENDATSAIDFPPMRIDRLSRRRRPRSSPA